MSGFFPRLAPPLGGALLYLALAAGLAGQAPPAPPLPPELGAAPGWLAAPPPIPAPPLRRHLRAVFYATDTDTGVASFRAHADDVSLLAPQCFSLDRDGRLHGSLPADYMAIARAHRVPVMPLVINDGFSRRLAHDLLHDALARDRALGSLLETARDDELAGFQIDFEGLSWRDRDAFSRFIAELAAGLHRHGKILSVAVAARTSDALTDNFKTYSGVYDYARLAGAADFLSVMAYPEHSGDDPGPLASYPWVEQVIQHELQFIPPEKFSLGVPTYETDWTERRVRISIWRRIGRRLRRFFRWTYHLFGRTHPAGDDADSGDLHWNAALQSSYRAYGSGRHYHVVWVEDARSFAAKLQLARQYHLRGFSVWRLGLEDPGIWAQLPAAAAPVAVMAASPAPPLASPAMTARLPIGPAGFAAARAAVPHARSRRDLTRRHVAARHSIRRARARRRGRPRKAKRRTARQGTARMRRGAHPRAMTHRRTARRQATHRRAHRPVRRAAKAKRPAKKKTAPISGGSGAH